MHAYEDASKVSKEAMDNALKSVSAMTKGFQQIASETSEFAKRAYEQQAEFMEKLFQLRSPDKVIALQNEYAKTAYQGWVSQATRMSEICSDVAKETYKPLEQSMVTLSTTSTAVAVKPAAAAKQAADAKAA
ncbi:phasin family protein [Aurantimonas sp. A2-1-M11]|uniref:phasin family protein n=1 Tax=Aurantimonas sp. A2-1-M11 TaxID=3113712 RepID=UPI002F94C0A9